MKCLGLLGARGLSVAEATFHLSVLMRPLSYVPEGLPHSVSPTACKVRPALLVMTFGLHINFMPFPLLSSARKDRCGLFPRLFASCL